MKQKDAMEIQERTNNKGKRPGKKETRTGQLPKTTQKRRRGAKE